MLPTRVTQRADPNHSSQRGESILLSQAVEISLEEGAILSNREKSGAGGNTVRCTNFNRLGHMDSKCVKIGFPLPNARAVRSFVSCFKYGRAGHLARDCRQRSNKESCGPRGLPEESRQGTTLGTREQGSSTEAVCGVQRRTWTQSGNKHQGPMRNQSRPQTRRK